MQVETTHEADIVCKDLIDEAYEAAHHRFPDFAGFSGIDEVWEKVEAALARKGALELCTTGAEDSEAQDVLEEVFEEACQTAEEDGKVAPPSEYVDYKALWERICKVLEVQV